MRPNMMQLDSDTRWAGTVDSKHDDKICYSTQSLDLMQQRQTHFTQCTVPLASSAPTDTAIELYEAGIPPKYVSLLVAQEVTTY